MQEIKKKRNKKTSAPNALYAVTAEISKKLKRRAKKLSEILAPYLAKADENSQESKLKEYSRLALCTVFGFLTSAAKLPQNIRPFGLSAVTAFSEKNSVLCVYIGASIGCLAYGRDSLASFIVYFMLYIVRRTFTESRFEEKIHVKMLECAGAGAALGIIRICSGTETPLYSYTAFLSLASVSAAFAYFFGVLFSPDEFASAKMSTVSICSYALSFALICSLDGFYVFGFDIQLAAACALTLAYAVINGFMHAGIVGFICGIACRSTVVSASLGLSGIAGAVFLSKSAAASAVAFAAVFLSVGAYSGGAGVSLRLFPSVLAGCAVFFPICAVLPDTFRISAKSSKIGEKSTVKSSETFRRKKLSEAFFSISDVFSKLAEKQKYPSFGDVELAVDKTFSSVCAGCALCEMCYAKKKTDIPELKERFLAIFASREAENSDFGTNMADKCIRLDRMCREVNKNYRELSAHRMQDNRTAILGAQYAGMARMINETGKNAEDEIQRDGFLEKSIAGALSEAEIPFSEVFAYGGRRKKVQVHGINLDRIPFGSAEIKKYILAKCGLAITEPSFDISEKNDYVMSFERAPLIRMEYAQACRRKEGEDVSGDTVNFIDGADGYFRACICDGMGSGKEAAASSRLASMFLEKMLDTDASKGTVLELLNNALMARSDESFSTVDLLEADMLTGRCSFVKAGAAPTYVLRSGKLYKIYSATPPVGIIAGFSAESTRFDAQPGDVIIMMSDGIVQNSEDSPWLAELIRIDCARDPAVLAGQIMEKAEEINSRSDDMSVCVIKVKKETASH